MISKYQKFDAITINRSLIKNAPYNPRTINEKNQKGLRKSLKDHGLVETLVWNERTGNLVGGHQRISQLDFLEKGIDYEITVSRIDVDEVKEKEINIILNNPSVQGEYDVAALTELFKDINIESTGFTDYDLSIFGVDLDVDFRQEKKVEKDIKDNIADIKAAKKRSKDKNISKGENYIVLTFYSIEAKESFLDYLGHGKDDRYIKGEVLFTKITNGKD